MLSQLISMMGDLQKSMNDMQNNMNDMQKSMNEIKKSKNEMHNVEKEDGQNFESIETKMDKMESKNEARHNEVIQQIKRLAKDQDFIWKKAARNERELEIMKRSSES